MTMNRTAIIAMRFVLADASSLALSEESLQATETILKTDIVEIKAPKHRSTVRKVALVGVRGGFHRRYEVIYSQ
jgi:hypothetical protein